MALLAAAVVALCALPLLMTLPRVVLRQGVPPVQLNAESDEPAGSLAAALQHMHAALLPLQKEVDAGNIVPKFGEKAHDVMMEVARKAGSTAPEVERVAGSILRSLFLRQLALLRQQLAAKPLGSRPLESISQADQQFAAQAEDLKLSGSGWSYDNERYALRAMLEGRVMRERSLMEQQALGSQSQQSTSEIISKLQSQMESLQQRVQNMRAGSPWFLSSSYRIPGTPFQIIGRYQQGRANFEMSLNPDRDPANSEAGFVSGLGPANLGVTFNVGI